MKEYLRTNRSILSQIKRSVIGKLPRKFHSYCVGAEKTGTTSVYHMFKGQYRTGYETDSQKTIQLVIDYLEGEVTKKEVAEILEKRDKTLNLEMESAHYLIYLSEILGDIFPEAKFIITIREPYSYLNSRLNWHLQSFEHTPWGNYVEYFLQRKHSGFACEEEILKLHDLYSLDTFLSQYADHYRRAVQNIPESRRIFICTSELNNARQAMSSFLNISKDSLEISHALKNTKKIKFLEMLDETFVRKKIWDHCSGIITEHFPETAEYYPLH